MLGHVASGGKRGCGEVHSVDGDEAGRTVGVFLEAGADEGRSRLSNETDGQVRTMIA